MRVGFFWTTADPENPRPDAWCSACNDQVQVTGGEWVGEALKHLEPKVLCGACYDVAKIFHMGGDPWSQVAGVAGGSRSESTMQTLKEAPEMIRGLDFHRCIRARALTSSSASAS
jgi:hypothetical protein